MLALVINAYAYNSHDHYLSVITDWIMVVCLAILTICLIIYAFNPHQS